jgi:hypothetical protein
VWPWWPFRAATSCHAPIRDNDAERIARPAERSSFSARCRMHAETLSSTAPLARLRRIARHRRNDRMRGRHRADAQHLFGGLRPRLGTLSRNRLRRTESAACRGRCRASVDQPERAAGNTAVFRSRDMRRRNGDTRLAIRERPARASRQTRWPRHTPDDIPENSCRMPTAGHGPSPRTTCGSATGQAAQTPSRTSVRQ